MKFSPQGPSVHRILQARILEWVAISFSGGSSQPRDQTQVFRTAGRFFFCLSHQGSPYCYYWGPIYQQVTKSLAPCTWGQTVRHPPGGSQALQIKHSSYLTSMGVDTYSDLDLTPLLTMSLAALLPQACLVPYTAMVTHTYESCSFKCTKKPNTFWIWNLISHRSTLFLCIKEKRQFPVMSNKEYICETAICLEFLKIVFFSVVEKMLFPWRDIIF